MTSRNEPKSEEIKREEIVNTPECIIELPTIAEDDDSPDIEFQNIKEKAPVWQRIKAKTTRFAPKHTHIDQNDEAGPSRHAIPPTGTSSKASVQSKLDNRFRSFTSTNSLLSYRTTNKSMNDVDERSNINEEFYEIDQETSISIREETTQVQCYIVFAVFISAISIGITMGYSALMLVQLQNERNYTISITEESWLGSSAPFAMVPGSILSGFVSEAFGRKKIFFLVAILYILSFLLIPLTNKYSYMILGRFVGGLSSGILIILCPTYVGEISHPRLKGTFMSIIFISTSLGILTIHLLADNFKWRVASYYCIIIPISHAILFIYCPESPRWLIKNNQLDKGRQIFYLLRGQSVKTEIELNNIVRELSLMEITAFNFLDKFKLFALPEIWKPTITVFICFIMVHGSGFITLAFYTAHIIRETVGNVFDFFTVLLFIDLIRIITSIIAIFIVKRLERRTLLIVGGISTSVSLFGLSFHTCFVHENMKSSVAFIPLILLTLFMSCVTIFLTPLPWILCSELLPPKLRNLTVVICTAFGLFCIFIVTVTWLHLSKKLSEVKTFTVCGFLVSFGSIILTCILPETMNQPLYIIEEHYSRGIT